MRILLATLCITFIILVMPWPSQASEWVKKKPDQLLLVVEHPDFVRGDMEYSSEYDGAWATSEYLSFIEGSKNLSAYYEYITRYKTHLVVSTAEFKENFQRLFHVKPQSLENFERGDKAKGLMGKYWTVSYTVLDGNGNKMTNCIGTIHAWEYKNTHIPAKNIGKAYGKNVFAVYCDSNKSISNPNCTKLRQLLDSVGVKKYKTPTAAHTSQPKELIVYCQHKDHGYTNSVKGRCHSNDWREITKAEYDQLKDQKKDTTLTEDPEAGSLKAKLKELKNLLDEGLITEEEAATKRAKLLGDL